LDATNKLLEKQVTVNQLQREEIQNIKTTQTWNTASNNEWDDTRNQIKIVIAQQKERTKEFHQRIQDLEVRHEEERRSWKIV
jgi:hypothetical protein